MSETRMFEKPRNLVIRSIEIFHKPTEIRGGSANLTPTCYGCYRKGSNTIKFKKRFLMVFMSLSLLAGMLGGQKVALEANDDPSYKEIGVEWTNNHFLGWCNILFYCDDDEQGFKTTLVNQGWYPSFYNGDSSAQENHWKPTSQGGSDTYYIEAVDIAYYSGHACEGIHEQIKGK